MAEKVKTKGMNLRINKQIREQKLRVIDNDGNQVGIITLRDALAMAEEAGLDLVEIVPDATPPVCKIIDYGKYRYDQTKREKESKKARHQIRVKEVKIKPNIDVHDFETKLRHARKFLTEGNKVKLTCFFRGREMAHTEIGRGLLEKMCEELSDISTPEAQLKRMGRFIHVVLAPGAKKK
ncbi:MAG: Translation initiation factor IF-3 [Chlamydiae bacterium]|nr:Translation initiation factor IF-3 [Chlamydiota bacterium]